MSLFRNPDLLPDEFTGGAVSIGNFDGVHRGHVRIVERLLAMARRVGGPAVVFTFDPHPARLLHPEAAPARICGTRRKAELLGELGVDAVWAYPTDRALLNLDAREFFEQIVCRKLRANAIVEGPNFFFGRGRCGTIEVLGRYCNEFDLRLEVVDPIRSAAATVSSSRIRAAIDAGDLDEARRLLGRPYRIGGSVIAGEHRGTALGYPTANIDGIDTLVPGDGIYAGVARVDGAAWPAAVSVGPNPTFGQNARKIEAYLIGYQGALYDHQIDLDFLARLREIRKFDSAEALVSQMDRDVADTRRIVERDAAP